MIRIRQLKVSLDDKINLKNRIAKKLHIKDSTIKKIIIKKESIDARNKNNIYYIYEVDIIVDNEVEVLRKNKSLDIFIAKEEKYVLPKSGKEKLNNRPVIIGSGPAGLFSAYLLAECGYRPIVIERGEKIEERVKTVEKFWELGILNNNSNVSFGEGGAGTFSDGKLNTLVKDSENRMLKVFNTFVACGAPIDILYKNKPHIGTDLLRNVIVNIRKKIIDMGGEFMYNSTVTDFIIENDRIKCVKINDKDFIPCDVTILAIGHSARDTFKLLYDKNIKMSSKPFAIGVRVQHPQNMINESQYGKYFKYLDNASYKLVYKASNNRGVYSFCMCPGGYVVNSSSEDGYLVINGMSNHKRDNINANSAIVVTVNQNDFGYNALDGMLYQKNIEKKAYEVCEGKIPVQLLDDFKNNKVSSSFREVFPCFKGGYAFADLNRILPKYVSDSIKEAMDNFEKKIKGFSRDDTIIAGVETRTSSPVRIERDDSFMSNILGIYPCGEGAGYAGGITTSAMDGIKVAESIIKKYLPFE